MSRQMRKNAPVAEMVDIPAMYRWANGPGNVGPLPTNPSVQRYVATHAFFDPVRTVAGVMASAWVPLALVSSPRANQLNTWYGGHERWWQMPDIRKYAREAWPHWVWESAEESDDRPTALIEPISADFRWLVNATVHAAEAHDCMDTTYEEQDIEWALSHTPPALAEGWHYLDRITRGLPTGIAAKTSWWCTLLRISGPEASNGYEIRAEQHVKMLPPAELPSSFPHSGDPREPRENWLDGIPEWAFIPGPGVPLWDIPMRRKFAERAFGEDYMIVYDRMVTRWAQSKGLMRRNGRWRR